MDSKNHRHLQKLITITVLLNILEGALFFFQLLTIPADPKNAFIGKFSLNRFLILLFIITLLLFNIYVLIKRNFFTDKIHPLFLSNKFAQIITFIGYGSAFLLWFTCFFPVNRLGDSAATFIRIKPLLIWLELIVAQTYFCFLFFRNHWKLSDFNLKTLLSGKNIRILGGIALTAFGLLFFLNAQHYSEAANPYFFPPSAPISPLQFYVCIVLFVVVFFIQKKMPKSKVQQKKWIWIAFFAIWIFTAILWNQANLPCTDDRPGPYPPNYECYPQINDAVYSIGSHYTLLGEGIYNHWLTDKPFYMVFLAVGQLLFGQGISQYMVFQIILLALLPALLFLYAAKYTKVPVGIFLTFLASIIGLNEISQYTFVGGVNAKLENPELLTSLFLILFCFALTYWWKSPRQTYLAAAAGGLLGMTSLLRLNPIFIAPIIVGIALISHRKMKSTAIKNVSLFSLCFLLTFMPTILASQDAEGNNYYWLKIENVINSRYTNTSLQIGTSDYSTASIPMKNAKPVPENYFDELQEPESNSTTIILHFWNNIFSSVAILPVNFSFTSINAEPELFPIWDFSVSEPLWERDLTKQNVVLLIINSSIILLGIIHNTRKNGISGLTPLIIQTGYHIGNAFAKTSGGRFLQAVNWVTLFYYSIGVVIIISFLIKLFTPSEDNRINNTIESAKTSVHKLANKNHLRWILIMCLISGMIVPLVNFMPSALAEENEDNVSAFDLLNGYPESQISPEKWEVFLSDPSHLIIHGIAYHPRYYRSANYGNNNPTFELMVLAKDHVIVSYLPNVEPDSTFSDGSEVVLFGCLMGKDNIWSSDRIFMESIAVFQLDHENGIFINEHSNWDCSHVSGN